jgi:hypothetical protein
MGPAGYIPEQFQLLHIFMCNLFSVVGDNGAAAQSVTDLQEACYLVMRLFYVLSLCLVCP